MPPTGHNALESYSTYWKTSPTLDEYPAVATPQQETGDAYADFHAAIDEFQKVSSGQDKTKTK